MQKKTTTNEVLELLRAYPHMTYRQAHSVIHNWLTAEQAINHIQSRLAEGYIVIGAWNGIAFHRCTGPETYSPGHVQLLPESPGWPSKHAVVIAHHNLTS